MTSPDGMSPQRLDDLVDGRTPTNAGEDDALVALVAELRSTEGASPALRARVADVLRGREAAAEPRRGGGWRRWALAVAPAMALAAAVVVSVQALTGPPDAPVPAQAERQALAPADAAAPVPGVPPPAAGPPRDAHWGITLRVRDRTALGAAVVRGRAAAQAAGAVVAAESQRLRTAGTSRVTLVLRVPADRAEGLLAQLARLGTVTARSADFRVSEPGRPAEPRRPEGGVGPGPPLALVRVVLESP